MFNPEIIYARAMGYGIAVGHLPLGHIPSHDMCYELAPFTTSLFDKTGNMCDAKSKSILKNKIEKSSRLAENDVYIEV